MEFELCHLDFLLLYYIKSDSYIQVFLMFNLLFSSPIAFVIEAVFLVIAISIHEFSHALAADKLGDPTPRLQGRLTLDPRAHLDPIGTLLMFIAGFGWGRPVVFDPFNLRNPRKDSAMIALAGPLSNIIMAIAASLLIRLMYQFPILGLGSFITQLLYLFINFNLVLAVFNLIPIHPLDGFNVVAGILPKKYYSDWMDLSRYGMIFLILLIFPFFGSSPISTVMQPIIHFLQSLLIPSRFGGII